MPLDLGVSVRTPIPGNRLLILGDCTLPPLVVSDLALYSAYPPAAADNTILTIAIHALDPKLGSNSAGGSGIINHQATTPIRVNPVPPRG